MSGIVVVDGVGPVVVVDVVEEVVAFVLRPKFGRNPPPLTGVQSCCWSDDGAAVELCRTVGDVCCSCLVDSTGTEKAAILVQQGRSSSEVHMMASVLCRFLRCRGWTEASAAILELLVGMMVVVAASLLVVL